jgi:hypothetical protein
MRPYRILSKAYDPDTVDEIQRKQRREEDSQLPFLELQTPALVLWFQRDSSLYIDIFPLGSWDFSLIIDLATRYVCCFVSMNEV